MKEPFPPPTQEQKERLAYLRPFLKKMNFDIFTFISRVKKIKGYFPPIDSIIKISEQAIKIKTTNPWAYYTAALKDEFPRKFADLSIKEHKKQKNEPTNIGNVMKRLSK